MYDTTHVIDNYKTQLELYNDLKDLYKSINNEADFCIEYRTQSIIKKYCGVILPDLLSDIKADERIKERKEQEVSGEIDADKFMKDHFVFTTVKM